MSQEQTRMLRCNRCGHVQPRNEAVCKNCGEDLMLYGSLITVCKEAGMERAPEVPSGRSEKNTAYAPREKQKKPRAARQPGEKKVTGSHFPKLLIGVICILAFLVIGIVAGVLQGKDNAAPAETTPKAPVQEAVLPDFAAFAGDLVDDSSTSSQNGVNTHIFANMSGKDLRETVNQYRALLESRYPYQLMGEAEKSINGMTAEYCIYRYTGPEPIPEMAQTIVDYEHLGSGHVWVAYLYNQDATAVAIDVVDTIPSVDNGDRAGTSTGTPPGGTTPPVTTPPTSGSGTVIAGGADFSSFNQIPANALPDLVPWSNGAAVYENEPSMLDAQYFDYEADESLIQAYISMLQSNGFTLVDTHVQEYKGSAYYSWGFICDGAPDAEKIGLQFEDTPCHVSLYYANKKGEYRMIVSKDILVCDTGLRMDGSRVDLSPRGTSAAAGLVKLADGSYQTSDGRLTAALGTAMILRDGDSYTTDAFYTQEDGAEILKIENFYRNEGIYFETPVNSIMQGDVFTQRDLVRWRWHDCTSMKNIESFAWDNMILVMPRDGKWLGPTYNDSVYESQTVRIMAYDPGGIAVFYFHAAFNKGDPHEIEALCVVDTSNRSGNIDDATYIKVGNTATLKYSHREDGTAYNTFDWSVIEGKDKVSISSGGDTCDVTALSPGVAAVQVVYDYSKEEPDPLTGIMRTVGHSKTQVYTFIIE